MPRPKSLTREAVAAAALVVIDRDGLAALSMRAVAAELGMATMSLYRYVADRAELEELVVDLVLAGIDLAPPRRAGWAGQVAALVERARAAIAAHPQVVPLTMAHRHTSANLLRWTEAVLGVLAAAGFTGPRRVVALRCLVAHLVGSLQLEHLGPLSGPGTAAMARLPAEEFPLLAETARHATRVPADEEFRRGLAAVLRGLQPDAG